MRKLARLFGFASVIFILIYSCSSETDNKIIGTWKFRDIKEITADTIQGMSPQDIELMKSRATYVFRRNKTYKLNLINYIDEGQWFISENGSALNMRSEKTNALGRATIRELTDKKLILVIQISPGYQQVLELEKLYK